MEFCSPSASFVTADPSYEAGMHAADGAGARVVKVPLTKTYAHDVRAMVAAAPDAGVFYICTPNNPTGTLTSHADVEWLLANKPKKSVVLVDEAYIHFCDAPSAIDLVKAGKDIVVLRTFSKLYGMAGLRCGFAIARPDVIAEAGELWRRQSHAGGGRGGGLGQPAGSATGSRSQAHQCRGAQPSLSPGSIATATPTFPRFPTASCSIPGGRRKQAIAAMAQQNIMIGRVWPVMPTYSRITVGTPEEMERFQVAFKKVMSGEVTGSLKGNAGLPEQHLDGYVVRA